MKPDAGALEAVRTIFATHTVIIVACRLPPLAPRASDARRGRQHLAEVEAVADGMLARLDELTATLGTVRALTIHTSAAALCRRAAVRVSTTARTSLAPA